MVVIPNRYEDLGEASYILGIKLLCDHQKRMLGLSQASYIDQIFAKFSMQDFKKGFVPFRVGSYLSANQHPKTLAGIERMRGISYASAVESLMCVMLCTRPDIYFVVGMVSRYQA